MFYVLCYNQNIKNKNKFMGKISAIFDKKINRFMRVLIINGIIMLILGVLIVWTEFMLRFIMGLIAIIVAYMFFYGAYKAHKFRKFFKKFIKF